MCIVDIGTQGMQGHSPFTCPLTTRHLGARQSPATSDLDALGTRSHCSTDRLTHNALLRDSPLQLFGDALGDHMSIQLGALYLHDIESQVFGSDICELLKLSL